MKSEFTALTRPRISSGVRSCTSELRTTTLTVSDAPMTQQRDDGQRDVGREREDDRCATPKTATAADHLGPDILPQRPAASTMRHGERTDGRWGAQQAKPPGAGMQDIARQHRQQRRGAAQQYREEIERNRARASPAGCG